MRFAESKFVISTITIAATTHRGMHTPIKTKEKGRKEENERR